EQVVVREIVNRTRQGAEEHEERPDEGHHLGWLDADLGIDPTLPQRRPEIPEPEPREARDDRGIGLPARPVETSGPEGRRPRGPGYYVRHRQAKWRGRRMKALNSAIKARMIAMAMMRGPMKRARMMLLSYRRCMKKPTTRKNLSAAITIKAVTSSQFGIPGL